MEPSNAQAVAGMATWIGALTRGGVIFGAEEERGVELAARVLGEDGLEALRTGLAAMTPGQREVERSGAIHACIWIAHADRVLAAEELELLRRIVDHADLSAARHRELLSAIDAPLELDAIAAELTEPHLRVLTLGLAWQLAWSDGALDDEERRSHHAMARALAIDEAHARAIRHAIRPSE